MKNKSSLIVITLLSILCAVSFYLYKNKTNSGTIDIESRNFKIEDTAAVTKIFIADKEGRSITLERTENGWVTPKKYHCRTDAISLLLYTMKRLEVKSPVAKNAKKGVIQLMIGRSLKVQAYHNNELIKQYYVGHENQDNNATYMILTNIDTEENYEEPFLMYIPGFEGYLSSRYIIDEYEWRDRLIINYTPPQLKSIKMDFIVNPDSSYIITLKNTTSFELSKMNGTPIAFEEAKMKQYLAYFQNISCEKVLSGISKHLSDSIINAVPFLNMTITDNTNKTKEFSFVNKYSSEALNRKYGFNYKYDPDRLFIIDKATKEISLIQYYVFGKIIQTYGYFLPKTTVKK